MNRKLYFSGFVSFIAFWVFAFVWMAILHTLHFPPLTSVIDLEPGSITILIYTFICIIGGLIMGAIWLSSWLETELVKGDSRKIRREKRKKFKIERKIKELRKTVKVEKLAQELEEERSELMCELKQLEREKKKEYHICEKCGKKFSLKACFCPHCGHKK